MTSLAVPHVGGHGGKHPLTNIHLEELEYLLGRAAKAGRRLNSYPIHSSHVLGAAYAYIAFSPPWVGGPHPGGL